MNPLISTTVLVISAMSTTAPAQVPSGLDAINGAFVRMLEREAPAASIVRGEPEPIAVGIARALESQRVTPRGPAGL